MSDNMELFNSDTATGRMILAMQNPPCSEVEYRIRLQEANTKIEDLLNLLQSKHQELLGGGSGE